MADDKLIDEAFHRIALAAPTKVLSAALLQERLLEPDPIEAAMEIARKRAALLPPSSERSSS